MIKSVYLGIAAAAMTLALTAGPLMADEVERGKIIVKDLCSYCHVMEPKPPEAGELHPFLEQDPHFNLRAPSIPELASKMILSEDYIHTTLRNPHPKMKRFRLSAAMVSDLVAYFRSLKLKADQAKLTADQAELKAIQADNGYRLAERLCAGCHVVGSEPAAGRTAPPFPKLSSEILLSEAYLDTWLRNPRPPMHSFQLPRREVSDIVTYLRSLKLKVDKAANGKRLAQRWCSNCHVVGSEPAAGRTAPPLRKLASEILLIEANLDTRLRNPHPAMHRFQLSAPMVSDLVAYLRSLKLEVDQAANGKRLAERLCSNCHVVGSEPGAGRTAPAFRKLADGPLLSESLIDFWLRNPRPQCTNSNCPRPRCPISSSICIP